MKKLFLLAIIATCFGCTSNAQVSWKTIEQAAQVNVKDNQRVFLVDFSTSWCGWCKKMDKETFSDPVIAAILNNYYIPVHFDAEGKSQFTWHNGKKYVGAAASSNGRPSTHPFTKDILGQKIGYPSIALFAPDGHLIQILQGYQNAYDFQIILWYFCSGDRSRYSFEEYQQIFDSKIKPKMMKRIGLAR